MGPPDNREDPRNSNQVTKPILQVVVEINGSQQDGVVVVEGDAFGVGVVGNLSAGDLSLQQAGQSFAVVAGNGAVNVSLGVLNKLWP